MQLFLTQKMTPVDLLISAAVIPHTATQAQNME